MRSLSLLVSFDYHACYTSYLNPFQAITHFATLIHLPSFYSFYSYLHVAYFNPPAYIISHF